MGRRSGFIGVLNAVARDVARAQRQAEAAHRRQVRENARIMRENARAAAAMEKEEKKRYLRMRELKVEDLKEELADRLQDLRQILDHTLSVDDTISFESLKIQEKFPPFKKPATLNDPPAKPTLEQFTSQLKKPNWFSRTFLKGDEEYGRWLKEAEEKYRAAVAKHEKLLADYYSKLEEEKAEYQRQKEAFEEKQRQRHLEVDEFRQSYQNGDAEAIIAYNSMVLERSEYPEDFPQCFRIAYSDTSQELVIDYELPNVSVVPAVKEYRYIKTRDEIEEKQLKQVEIKNLYEDIVASVAIRTLHEVFEADQGHHLNVSVFNGYVHTVDPATGKDIEPFLISVRAVKESFMTLDLSRIEKRVCLKNLGAQISPQPTAMVPVKPIVEFNMVDKRFIDHADLLEGLDHCPNLYDLNPFEFENLVCNLFGKMGLESKLTRSSKDGGVDAVAYDARPVLGGKVVIQAKRYRNTVGVSAVRDLYGTMMNEGANKGILVTTSGYGPDAFEFAKDKPIELIDGGALLYLLDQIGVRAKILLPQDGFSE